MDTHAYTNKVRVRVNGLLTRNDEDAILLVQLHSPITNELVWTPPGGGLEFGETMEACLRREFMEETGLKVQVQQLKYISELVEPPFHAIEFFFTVSHVGGSLKLGSDPEHKAGGQLLQNVQWISMTEIAQINLVPSDLEDILFEKSSSLNKSVIYSSF